MHIILVVNRIVFVIVRLVHYKCSFAEFFVLLLFDLWVRVGCMVLPTMDATYCVLSSAVNEMAYEVVNYHNYT